MCLVVYRLDTPRGVVYAVFLIKMDTYPEKPKVGLVKHKVTSDFILDEYEKAKKKRGKPRQEAMDQLKILSQNMGSYIVKEEL